MSAKPEEDKDARVIGARSRFDWVFLAALVPAVYTVAIRLSSMDNKLDNAVTRTELTRWTVELASSNMGKGLVVPVFLPTARTSSDGSAK